MKVFISWSGHRAQLVAEGLKALVADVLGRADPWVSSEDIAVGDRWADQIGKRLQDTNYGVIVVTADNKDRPWLNFEAGAIAKSVETGKVMPYLVGLRKGDIAAPLGMFQAAVADAVGTRELVDALNKGLAPSNDAATMDRRFTAAWPRLEGILATLPVAATEAPSRATRSDRDVLEEILSMVRASARTRADAEEHDTSAAWLHGAARPVDVWLHLSPPHVRAELMPKGCMVRINMRTGEVQRVLADGEAREVPDDEVGVLIPALQGVLRAFRPRFLLAARNSELRRTPLDAPPAG